MKFVLGPNLLVIANYSIGYWMFETRSAHANDADWGGGLRISHTFFREVEHLGQHSLGRIRNRDCNAVADQPDQLLSVKSLYVKATKKPTLLGLAHWVLRHSLTGQLVIFSQQAKSLKNLRVLANWPRPSIAAKRPNPKKIPGN
jgi:ATP-dependent helicase YprA (DUF1998 family)